MAYKPYTVVGSVLFDHALELVSYTTYTIHGDQIQKLVLRHLMVPKFSLICHGGDSPSCL
jgi:hypothetical protein